MDLRHMRHFVAVAEERHFGRAARRLNMAQPPLSQSIRRLEVDLGVDLLERSRRSVELTEAGRIFLVEARRTLMQADLARRMAQRTAARAIEIRVSFIGPALFRVVPLLLKRFRERHPEVEVRLFEQGSALQIQGLLAGDYDIGFVTAGTDNLEGCDSMVIERAGSLAAVPADWPLAAQPSVTLEVLARQPFILPPRRYASQGPDTMALFKNRGLVPNVTQEATQTNTTLSLVGAGLGCSIVVATAALVSPHNVALLPIEDYQPQRGLELLVAWPPDQPSEPVAAFVDLAHAVLLDHPHWLDNISRPVM